jgi:superfamily II DNA or RNA helicase
VVQLRPYQKQKIEEIYEAWQNHRSVMLQMPTGTGKTVLFNQIVKDELAKNSKVLIIAHRRELIDQNVSRLWNDFGIQAGTITANGQYDLSIPVQVAMIQTLSKRNKQENLGFNPSTVIVDEAHHVPAKSYRELWKTYPDAKFLGVTATPIRLNGEGFKDLFDTLVVSKSIKEFIEDGYLAKLKYIGRPPLLPKLDLSDIAIIGGDYDSEQLSEKMCEEAVMANLIKSYLDHAKGKKMIVFAVTTEHSESIAERYQSIGFAAAHIDSDTSQKERNEIINKFRSGEIQILSNVGIISEGFDVPDCEVVQLARPTKSLVMYLQQVGRCMRPSRSKPYSIVLDNVGLYDEFGSPKLHRDWSLEAATKTKLDNIDSDSNENFARELLEEVDETLIVLEDVEMNTVDELKEKLAKINSEIEDLEKAISDAINNGQPQIVTDSLKTAKGQKENERDTIRRELDKALGLEQGERLKEKLEEFQYYIDSFFEDVTWETEEDKLTFMAQLKVGYDKAQKKSLATLDKTIHPVDFHTVIDKTPIINSPVLQADNYKNPVPQPLRIPKKGKRKTLQVKFRGEFIQGKDQSEVFVNTLQKFGILKVKNLGMSFGIDLVSDKKAPHNPNMSRQYAQHHIEGYWICTHISAEVKEDTLKKIASKLGEHIEVKLI